MKNTLLGRLSSLLLPLGLYSAGATAGASYQRTYLSSSISASTGQLRRTSTALPRDLIDLSGDGLDIQTAHPVRELVIVDGAIAEADKSVLRRALKPGVQLVELDSSAAGLPQLINALGSHKNLAAIHVMSHAEAGAILLGNSRITPENIQQEVHAFAALKGAVREGGDLLFYGCNLAANEAGEALLDIISNNTGLDVAASNNLTGNSELQGDWDLEVTRGNIESSLAFSEKALMDFSGVLFTGTINFSQTKNAGDYYGNATVNAEVWATGTSGYFLIIDGATRATELYTGLGSSGQAAFTLNTENSVTLRFNNNEPFSPQSLKVANIAGGGGTTHSFTFTSNKGSFSQNVVNGTPATINLTSFGANVTYITISSTLVYAWMDDFSVVGVGITVDETAPVFQNGTPSVGSQTLSGATLSADLDEEGAVYYVVVADGASAPSATQVRNGQNSSGAAALASGNFTTTSTTGSEAFSGLSAGTNYDLYVVAQDDEGTPNVQASATLVNFTTQGTDSDATLAAAGGVAEPIGLATTIDSVGEAVNLFDFTISDGGTSDGLATTVSQIVVNVSGTSTDAERSKITWRLNGPDASNVTGTYSAGADTITFSGLSISVADGGNETYTVNAYYNDNTALTEDRTIILSVDGDTNLTVSGSGTQMASGQSAVTNGSGTTIDVVASQLVFTTQPAGSVSGAALTTQPVVRARDAFGNTDVDFTETITLTEASAGTLTNGTQAATAGVATFTNLTYTATADQQAFTLTANDQDGVGSNLSTVDANSVTSDVVATQLVFTTQPAPTSVVSGQGTSLTTVPVVSARDANSVVDTGYSTGITLAEVNGAGSATMTGTGDTDGNGATVSITPSSGVSTFTGMQITYTNSGVGSETFNLRASSGGLTTADSSQLTAATTPTVTDGNISISGASGTSGAYKIGDTVTATWNNTAGGNNNAGITGVTVDFSQFGGGAAVVASNSSDTWTATYTIVSGGIDTTNRNISVTATNVSGDSTTADTTNATVDNVAPVVTNGSISISGATGTSGAYKIGDTVTASWDNSAIGDDNSDTISSATVNFSQFGGGAAVAATNSSGTWTATYTIVAGAIDTTNRNISFSANDNAGNTTTTADTSNATLDNVAPFVSDVYIGISGGTGTAGAYIVGDTVTASWDNSAIGDDNSDTISSVTVDFSQFGGGAAVVATNSSGTWTATYTILAGAIDTTNRNVSVTATDNAGNTRTQSDSSNATVDNIAPAVSSVTVPANATYVAGQNLDFSVNTDGNITVNTGGGTPRIALTLGASTVYASYLSGSGSSALTFRYTVQSGDLDTDGIVVAGAIETNGGTLKDSSGNNLNSTLNSVGNTAAVLVDAVPVAPIVTDGNISISGASGAGGAYKIGDAVTATWNNTAGGDNNSGITGVTVNFSQFGGGAAVVATNSSGTWTATYTIVSGAIDAANRNVSITATNAVGPTTTADTTNATVDNVAPTVSNASIGISGATGTSGAYKIGDTVTATWNNTAGGDNNSDTISAATVNFSAFGGGAAVAATNSAGTWTATYTIVAGAISAANLNISVTATDNAGNATTGADATNATVDNVAPTVGSVSVPANGAYGTGSSLTFTVNFSENVTVNTAGGTPRLTLTVGATTVYADYLSGTGTSALTFRYAVTTGQLDTDGIAVGVTLEFNGGTIKDASGNDMVTTLNSIGATTAVLVDGVAPTVTSVAFDQASVNAGNQNAISVTLAGAETGTTANYSITSSGGGTPVVGSVAVAAAGQQLTGLNVSGLNDGTLTISLTLTDTAGNVSTPAVTDTIVKAANDHGVIAVPTLSQWSLAALMALLAGFGGRMLHGRRRQD